MKRFECIMVSGHSYYVDAPSGTLAATFAEMLAMKLHGVLDECFGYIEQD